MEFQDRHSIESDSNEPLLPADSSAFPDDASIVQKRLRIRLIIVLLAMVLAVESGTAMLSAPTMRIYESIICQQYYEKHDPSKIGTSGQIPEVLCKNEEIQGEVAIVKGYGELFNALFGVVLAIPYGLFADRFGRKYVLRLSIPGFVLNMVITAVVLWPSNSLPLRLVWISSLAWLLGGGIVVAGATIWTMMADVTTESQRAAIFFQFGVATMGADFLATAVSSWSMAQNPWIPMFLGWGITLLGILPILALPETSSALSSKRATESADLLSDSSSGLQDQLSSIRKENLIEILLSKFKSCFQAYEFLLHDRQLLLLLSTFLVFSMSRGTTWFLVQYTSKQFQWTMAEANYIVSAKAILTVLLFVAILPASSWYLTTRLGIQTRSKDLILAKASITFLVIGSIGVGLSPSIFLMMASLLLLTLGAGFVFVTRSLITTMVRKDQIARLYTIVEIMEAVGMVLTGPIIALFFNWGLTLGGAWIGLPWIVMGGLFFATAVAVWMFKLPHTARQ